MNDAWICRESQKRSLQGVEPCYLEGLCNLQHHMVETDDVSEIFCLEETKLLPEIYLIVVESTTKDSCEDSRKGQVGKGC